MFDKIKDKKGVEHIVLICDFKDGLGVLAYHTADRKILDFCPPHYWDAINKECDATRGQKTTQTFAELKAKRLAELQSN